jgi:hypothetical protein
MLRSGPGLSENKLFESAPKIVVRCSMNYLKDHILEVPTVVYSTILF